MASRARVYVNKILFWINQNQIQWLGYTAHPLYQYYYYYLLLLMTFIGRKLRHSANVPSQPLHNNSYPRTGTFSVVS